MPFRGVNLASAEFAMDSSGGGPVGTHGTEYIYPDPAYASGYDSADYFIGKGMTTFRLPFRWERLQPNRGQAFNATEFGRLTTTVNRLLGKGAVVILDPHNYARYFTSLIGSSTVPNSHFADFWRRLAEEFKGEPNVLFGLMNEPHDMDTNQWLNAANAAIAAIRGTGATNLILVPGNAWSGAATWGENWYGTPNSQAMLNIVDPGNNYAFEVHQYLDANSSGTASSCVSTSVASQRMQAFTNWLRTHGKKGFLGEFGTADNSACAAATHALLDHMEANADVYLGWTWWAAGPWWGNYFMTLEPTSSGGDRGQMRVLAEHLETLPGPSPTPTPPPAPPPAPTPTPAPTPSPPPETCTAQILQVESMSHSTGGAISGGWNLWSNGNVSGNATFSGGTTAISVRAAGTVAAGTWPEMRLYVGSAQVGTVTVSSRRYRNYDFEIDGVSGTQEIRVAFLNDYYQNGEDRNLLLDRVVVGCGE